MKANTIGMKKHKSYPVISVSIIKDHEQKKKRKTELRKVSQLCKKQET